jgi:LmbE family N-acetylglucosaminyl deacetylase
VVQAEALTLMAVHAHPDDEASSTGGILARYADEGVRTVVVTCTNGELGDAPGGVKPGSAGHDEQEVVRLRRAELEASCAILGVSALEMLGFRDSGMMGWPQNEDPSCFWSTPVALAAAPLIGLIERYRPQVIVTYDANGFYGHPDHIQAHRITLAALQAIGAPARVYFPTFPHSRLPVFLAALREAGLDEPTPDETGTDGDERPFGTPDEQVSSIVDCSAVVDRKFDALRAHQSQIEDTFFLKMGRERFDQIFASECFVRHESGLPVDGDEIDLFAGLR